MIVPGVRAIRSPPSAERSGGGEAMDAVEEEVPHVLLLLPAAHIKKQVTPHTLRHSFATGLLEAGVDLMAISKLLGHSSFTTTMIYLHCRKQHLDSTPSPIDWLPARQCPKWIDPSLQLPSEPSPAKRPVKPQPDPNE